MSWRPTPEHRRAYQKRVAEEESNIIAALDALVHHPANGRKIRSRLVILQNVLADLTGIRTTPTPRLVDKTVKKTDYQKMKEKRCAITGVIEQLREYILANKLCGKDDNLKSRRKVLAIVYEKLTGTPWRTNASPTPSDNSMGSSSASSPRSAASPDSAAQTVLILPAQIFSFEAHKVLKEMLPSVYDDFFIPTLFPLDRFLFFRSQIE